jgi:hypothetical protein
MIYVNRSRVERPDCFDEHPDSPAQSELAKARAFVARRPRQGRFEFRVFKRGDVSVTLMTLFYGKCAYCETFLGGSVPIDSELFRPAASVAEAPDHPGYWWLASRWENMLLACGTCNRQKANRFPLIAESRRAFAEGREVNEQPLLLNPCEDHPEEHLVFNDDGTVVSETPRGQATISVLGLNRDTLVQARRETAERFKNATGGELVQAAQAGAPFAAVVRQIANRREKSSVARSLVERPGQDVEAERERIQRNFEAYQRAQSSYSLASNEGRKKARSQRRLIERITVRDVKAIRSLELSVTPAADGRTPWLMLLGENATGKSTILNAVTLTLAGATELARLAAEKALHPSDFVRYGCKQGSVAVKMSGDVGEHELTFRPDRIVLRGPTGKSVTIVFGRKRAHAPKMLTTPPTALLAYGATRLLPRNPTATGKRGQQRTLKTSFLRISNLFDPFVPLFDAQQWLLGLRRKHFDRAALILKDLLELDASAELVRAGGKIFVIAHGARVPLAQLSDGYQSVVALTIDILELATRLWENPASAEGLVLLDEVGSHLHPTWKLRIVEGLRRAFPGMQFLASTHEPLCLRGLGADEVAVMRRDEDQGIVAVTRLPSPGDFRVDQLLTSEFFGLNSTTDPDVERLFDEYYALMAIDARSSEQEARLAILHDELKGRRYLGDTLREQLMYEAIDKLVANHKRRPRVLSRGELKQEAVDQVSRVWRETVGTPEPS